MDVKYPRYRTFKSGLLSGWKEKMISRPLDLVDATKVGSSSLICGPVLSCLILNITSLWLLDHFSTTVRITLLIK